MPNGQFVDPLLETRKKKNELIKTMENFIAGENPGEVKNLNDEEVKTYGKYEVELDALNASEERLIKLEATKKAAALAGGDGSRSEQPEEKAAKHYSVAKVLRAKTLSKLDGFELEMHQEGVKEARTEGISRQYDESIMIPGHILHGYSDRTAFENDREVGTTKHGLKYNGFTRDMTATGGSGGDQGGTYVPTLLQGFIPALRDRLVLSQLGASFMTGLTGNIDIPEESTLPTYAWEGETDALAESSPTTTKKSLTPKRLGTFVDVSNQLLLQNSVGAQNRVATALIDTARIAIETAAIEGTGSSNQPEGILSTSGIGAIYAGGAAGDGTNADGAAPVWADVVNLLKEVAVDKADFGSLGYLINPQTMAKLMTTEKASSTAQFIMGESMGLNGLRSLAGYNCGVSTLVPGDLTKGSGTALSAMIFGNFNDLIIGQWGGLEVMVNPYTRAKEGITEFIVNHWVDVLVARAVSFAAGDDFVTT